MSDDTSGFIEVEVAYAEPRRQWLTCVRLPPGATIAQALQASGFATSIPLANLDTLAVGVWSKVKPRDSILRAGDRVEIYRPLSADPKQARRKRAAEQKPPRQA
jgi:hypothetical protein